jgi:hypothetical protein
LYSQKSFLFPLPVVCPVPMYIFSPITNPAALARGSPVRSARVIHVFTAFTVNVLADSTVIVFTVTLIFPVVAPVGTFALICVAVEDVTVAAVPLNFTTLFAGVVLKFVPVIVTSSPTYPVESAGSPDAGVNDVSVGGMTTIKSSVDVTVIPLILTEISPVVDPAGTVTERVVAVEAVTVAAVLLNLTMLFPGVVLKSVPVIVTGAPIKPEVGVKEVIVWWMTVKSSADDADTPPVPTEIFPVVAPEGTVVEILVLVDEITVADTPLNSTVFDAGVSLKPVPLIVTAAPTLPETGEKPVTVR